MCRGASRCAPTSMVFSFPEITLSGIVIKNIVKCYTTFLTLPGVTLAGQTTIMTPTPRLTVSGDTFLGKRIQIH